MMTGKEGLRDEMLADNFCRIIQYTHKIMVCVEKDYKKELHFYAQQCIIKH